MSNLQLLMSYEWWMKLIRKEQLIMISYDKWWAVIKDKWYLTSDEGWAMSGEWWVMKDEQLVFINDQWLMGDEWKYIGDDYWELNGDRRVLSPLCAGGAGSRGGAGGTGGAGGVSSPPPQCWLAASGPPWAPNSHQSSTPPPNQLGKLKLSPLPLNGFYSYLKI